MESSSTVLASKRAVDAPTLTEAMRRTAAEHGDLIALRTVDDSISLSWSQLLERVDALAGGLAKLGIGRGDTVAIMLTNRPEFNIVDLAAAMLGATPFSIYTTLPEDEIAYLCTDAGAKVVIVEQVYLATVVAVRERVPGLEQVIVIDGIAPAGTIALAQVEGSNPEFDVSAAAAAVSADDVLTLIYTSGTTGKPKGVQLSHRNVMAAARGIEEIIPLAPGVRVISWLPAAHIAERMAHHYVPIIYAGTITVCPNPRDVISFLPRVRPEWFFAVPRIWEKLKAGLEAMQAAQPAEQQETVRAAIDAALARVRLRQRGEPVPPELEARVAQADEQMFSHLRAALGLDQILAVHVGAAPTPVEVLEFFHALGIELAELWGMSETCAFGMVNRPGHVKIGTVGPPAPGVEVKLAQDGELLCRGEVVMLGYRNAPQQTAEAIDADGWLHTGDIATIDADGFVTLIDRKKELIINAAGKNMSPANIEGAIKSGSPLIGQAICIGDMRPYNTALLVLDADYAPAWATKHGIEAGSLEQLAHEPAVLAAVRAGIDAANTHLARVEQIKKFTILDGDWHPGGDELTPTMKLKRKPIASKYRDVIDAMYE
ncbi:MAG: AMP-dependent synthetase/ligase [Solirubrobacteraceae bacterium]